jgi:exopolyphosphatase/guanosine-5'-triphosphate,3'-diphosphate pyrophosphatase
MSPIIPRWEWRTFDASLREVAKALLRHRSGSDQHSDELYFLSTRANVKVRDGLMDIKVLREVDANGLQQWLPVMKTGFPLPAAEAGRVFEALDVGDPPAASPSHTLDQFVETLARLPEPIRAVNVHKIRRRCTVGTVMAEVSDVEARRLLPHSSRVVRHALP